MSNNNNSWAATTSATHVASSGTITINPAYGSSLTGHLMKIPEMPQSLEGASFADIQAAYHAIQNSQIGGTLNNLNYLTSNCPKLKQWEIEQIEKAFLKFLAQHNSPLAKALK